MYYYLGLEARQRENVYNELDEAMKDASYIAGRLLIPIRIFQMLPNKKSRLSQVVKPNSGKRPNYRRTFQEDDGS